VEGETGSDPDQRIAGVASATIVRMGQLPTDLDYKGLSFILAGQNGWLETRSALNTPIYRASESEVIAVLGTIDFFAPIARKRRGMRDSDAADVANVVWADVD
jgi:hypothetical protein